MTGATAPFGGYPATPPPLRRPVVLDQRWRDVTFVHWPVRAESVAHMYPPGTRPDVFADGMTYVALVPFAMSETAVGDITSTPLLRHVPGDQHSVVLD